MMKRESRRSNRKRNMRKTLKIQMRQIRKRMLRKEKSRKKRKNLMSDPIKQFNLNQLLFSFSPMPLLSEKLPLSRNC